MINQEHKDILNKYAEIKLDIKRLEAMADELNPKVTEIIRESGAEKIEIGDVGKLTLNSRRTWIYSKGTQDMEKLLKSVKKEEEQLGTADYKETHYVVFKGLSDRDE